MPHKTTKGETIAKRHRKQNKQSKSNRKSLAKEDISDNEVSILSIDEDKISECLRWFIQTKYSLLSSDDETIAIVEAMIESFLELVVNISSDGNIS